MRPTSKLLLGTIFLSSLVCLTVDAGPAFSPDRTLSLLRGSWQRHTYREKWVLAFDSDTRMRFDFQPATYTIDSGQIRIESADGEVTYGYSLGGDRLLISLPDGSGAVYERENPGTAERRLDGSYYTISDSEPGSFLTFSQGRYFSYRDRLIRATERDAEEPSVEQRPSGIFEPDGVYRVEGAFIILVFNDGEVAEASVREYDPDGNITGILYGERFFGKDQFFYLPPLPSVAHDYPPPILWPVPPQPPPPEPIDPWVPPAGGGAKEKPEEHRGHDRTFGETRGGGHESSNAEEQGPGRNSGVKPESIGRDFGTTRGAQPESRGSSTPAAPAQKSENPGRTGSGRGR
jgi:hypothetical protein